ncbi:GNAT family N-acetyltransferase [Variovorax sp. J22P271]|uniref:GNAT family N-acetyltransferase n=1 Tax=Variovorax davisae TaxID=3053515 RepID=UPI0025749464|nr:GNAT family N-acetyltransferase [Variovorax sp. J22P271]MDM0036950.1 GNAT family N-acetyltransferase [Variovorax sp. J22P271]
MAIEIITERLHLRQWKDADRAPYAALNMDPVVMRFFPGLQAREESDNDIERWSAELDDRGWSNWAVETRASGNFIGFIGLTVPRRALAFMPCVELGYRLAREHWGKGYATEGAKAALRVGFDRLGLQEIVSFTANVNLPSRAVMERVGMTNSDADFDYPNPALSDELKKHCLYRLSRERWLRGNSH